MLNAVHLHPVMGRVGCGHDLAAVTQPVAHELDLVALGDDLALAENAHVRPRTVRCRPAGNQDRLGVVRDHARHEIDVGLTVGLPYEIGPGFWLGCLPRPGLRPRGGHRRRDQQAGRDQSTK